MNEKKASRWNHPRQNYALFVIAGLLILTAWGNAYAMLAISALALVGFAFLNRGSAQNNWTAVLAGFLVAGLFVIAAKLMF